MSIRMWNHSIIANQYPERTNSFSRAVRSFASLFTQLFACPTPPSRPQGISAYMRVKDEKDWIAASIASLSDFADEIIVADNGSTDGTWDILQDIAASKSDRIKLWCRPELHHADLSNFALEQTTFRWVFRFDGDMIARTSGLHNIEKLRSRVLALNPRRYYLIYLRHVNLSGDLCHQDPREMVHTEEYIHTFSEAARFIHPGRFEAVKFPLYYKPLFWYEPYAFHVNIKPARRMLLRYFWEDWMELKDYQKFPTLEDYVNAKIEQEFGTKSWEEAQNIYISHVLREHIRYDPDIFGPYPDFLKSHIDHPKYAIRYKDNQIVGRSEP